MRSYILTLGFIITGLTLHAQNTFYKNYLYTSQLDVGCVQLSGSNGYILVAGTAGLNNVVKTNLLGDTVWTKSYSSIAGSISEPYIIQTNDGGYLFSEKKGIVKTNSTGDVMWAKRTSMYQVGPRIVRQTTDGGYIMTGGYLSRYVGKLDASGDLLWNKFYNIYWTDGGGQGGTTDIRETSDGGYIMVGFTYMYGAGLSDYCLTKIDASGNSLWSKTYGGSGQDLPFWVQQTSDGGFIMVGNTLSFGASDWDIYVVRTDNAGNLLWSKTYAGNQEDEGSTIEQTYDGGYIISAASHSFSGKRVCLIKTDSLGAVTWSNAYMDDTHGNQPTALQTLDGGYIIGSVAAFPRSSVLVKLDGAGTSSCFQFPAAFIEGVPATLVSSPVDSVYDMADSMINMPIVVSAGLNGINQCSITSVAEQIKSTDLNVFPNPFINSLNIRYSEDNYPHNINFYSSDGSLVKTLSFPDDSTTERDFSLINIDTKDLNTGIYILEVNGKKGREFMKVVKYH